MKEPRARGGFESGGWFVRSASVSSLSAPAPPSPMTPNVVRRRSRSAPSPLPSLLPPSAPTVDDGKSKWVFRRLFFGWG